MPDNPLFDAPDDVIISEISQRQWRVKLAETARCQLTIVNGGANTATFLVRVQGVKAGWVALSPAHIQLDPGERGVVDIAITPPRQHTSRTGAHPLIVQITSPQYAGRRSQHSATLTIKPYYAFGLGQPTPRRQTLSRWQDSAQVAVSLVNRSNAQGRFVLRGADDAQACRFVFQATDQSSARSKQTELCLAPGESVNVLGSIHPARPPLWMLHKCTYRFTLTATLQADGQNSRCVRGRLQVAPLLNPWLAAFVLLCLAVLAVYGRLPAGGQAQPAASAPATAQLAFGEPSAPPSITPSAVPLTPTLVTPASKLSFEVMFQEIAARYNLDWRLLVEIAYRESEFNLLATGAKGEMGLMQILPATWNGWAAKLPVTDGYDPYSNVWVAADYLSYLREDCLAIGSPGVMCMLISYNWGPGNLRQHLQAGGALTNTPEWPRQYAQGIIQAVSSEADPWREVLPAGEVVRPAAFEEE